MSEVRSSKLETGLSSSDDPVEVEEDTAASGLWQIKAFHDLGEACVLDVDTLSRFPVHPFIMEHLGHFNISLGQLMPNLWRIVVHCMEIWLAVTEGDMIKVDELIYLYRLKESKEHGDEWKTPFDEVWGDLSRLLRRLRAPSLGASSFLLVLRLSSIFIYSVIANLTVYFHAIERRPKLRYRKRIEAAIMYAKAIDDLVDPRTLALYCLGPELSTYKKSRVADKGKEKADSRSSSVWDDTALALARAQEVFSIEKMSIFYGIPTNEVMGQHVRKLVQVLGESLHLTSEFLIHEAKVSLATSRVEALEAENYKMKKDLISAMDEANIIKEKAKVMGDDLKVESWYYKGFELLRRYLVKHPSRADLESLDLEEVDWEMSVDEASQSAAPVGDTSRDANLPSLDNTAAA
ncbi:hypothetical protein SO802_002968 [Lithocarpus litseifolius]|uniref:Uncharacterized protein n=1 Tax=Lithocarpus litseifolius TaxID=425828 RepID=A0AAW2E0P4_9ROSI